MTDDIQTIQMDYAEAMEMLWRQSQTIKRLQQENEKLRDMLLRSDKLTRQEWYDMRNTQLAEEANAAALKETGDEQASI